MKITCFIIDDEPDAIELLRDYVQMTPGLELTGTSLNPVECLDLLTGEHAPAITFLDVDMRQLSGLELAGMVNLYTTVVFTTAFPEYALEAFDKEAFDFLLKPINYERFAKCIQRVKRRLSQPEEKVSDIQPNDFFTIKSEIKGRLLKIRFDEVIYIEGAVNYIQIFTAEGKHMTYLTLKEIERHLPPAKFIRIHRSFIVNLDFVTVVERSRLRLTNGETLVMGDHYKTHFLELMDKNLIKTDRHP
ncbi:DNA-binding response regulator [Mucilaginibacter hurinus]|uniref:DNA-binding response regulator n=1 Tax=Mucilaginibacter hurinus TaxID=2201324 RepID=A0A367GTS9_9SPHI|nr:LytTR family DNA-binding domain-containing protein [Mucilaginibacter hurinus]RCH56824.1 DNA-binding response regulator [Mucilaginibacter hurinus]